MTQDEAVKDLSAIKNIFEKTRFSLKNAWFLFISSSIVYVVLFAVHIFLDINTYRFYPDMLIMDRMNTTKFWIDSLLPLLLIVLFLVFKSNKLNTFNLLAHKLINIWGIAFISVFLSRFLYTLRIIYLSSINVETYNLSTSSQTIYLILFNAVITVTCYTTGQVTGMKAFIIQAFINLIFNSIIIIFFPVYPSDLSVVKSQSIFSQLILSISRNLIDFIIAVNLMFIGFLLKFKGEKHDIKRASQDISIFMKR